ncbi:hypothetical protein MSHI_41080 [Mycobacterium shinjukuense]|uniref:Uncharacterized protein n=1 Tax=Mycobacterium shinjukuense TaxID=398694 RepID=A0A7I7MWC5_9MYCO|nr:hypothetical protein MSHI_41080 [Mycobacterium shinjukuense]
MGKPGPDNPDIAELAIRAGIDPAHVAGTDNAPTVRAWPRPADAAPKPAPWPNPFIACCTPAPPANFAAPSGNAVAAPADPAPLGAPARIALLNNIIIGDIAMPAGVDNSCTPATAVPTGNDCSVDAICGAAAATIEAT